MNTNFKFCNLQKGDLKIFCISVFYIFVCILFYLESSNLYLFNKINQWKIVTILFSVVKLSVEAGIMRLQLWPVRT